VSRAFLWVFTGPLAVAGEGLDNSSLLLLRPVNNLLTNYS
jgi:hypothetical protein